MCSDAQAVRHTIAEATRTKAQIHFLHLQLEGESVNRQDQREARLLPGDIMLCDSSRPHEIVFEKPIHMLAFGFSDELMRHYVHNPQSISAVLIPGNKGIGGLLSEVLINVWRRRQNGSEFDVCLGPALEITLGIYLTQDQPLRFYSHFPHPRSQAFY